MARQARRGRARRGGAAKRTLCMVAGPSGRRSLRYERTAPAIGRRRLAHCLAFARFHPTAGVQFGGAQRRRHSSQRRCKGGRGRLTGETFDSRGTTGPIASAVTVLRCSEAAFSTTQSLLDGLSPEMQRSKSGRWGRPRSPLRGDLGRLRHQLHLRNGLCSILTAAHGVHILQSCSVEHDSQWEWLDRQSGRCFRVFFPCRGLQRLLLLALRMQDLAIRPERPRRGRLTLFCDSSPARRGDETRDRAAGARPQASNAHKVEQQR